MTSTATAPPATPKKQAVQRDYIVLRELKDGSFKKAGTFKGASADEANGKAHEAANADLQQETAAYVAVPATKWHRKTPTVEVKTSVKWS